MTSQGVESVFLICATVIILVLMAFTFRECRARDERDQQPAPAAERAP